MFLSLLIVAHIPITAIHSMNPEISLLVYSISLLFSSLVAMGESENFIEFMKHTLIILFMFTFIVGVIWYEIR